MPELDPLPPVMTPVASGPADAIATPELHARYLAAQEALEAHLDRRDALHSLYARIARAEGVLRRRKLMAWSSAAARARVQRQERHLFELEMERVTQEASAITTLQDVLFPVGSPDVESWRRLRSAFEAFARSDRLWDLTALAPGVPQTSRRIGRHRVTAGIGRLATVRPDVDALRLGNANGPTMWLYPAVLALQRSDDLPALIDLGEVRLEANRLELLEADDMPLDASHTELSRKDLRKLAHDIGAGPPARLREPVRASYGTLRITSQRGLHELYLVSDPDLAHVFADQFRKHRHRLRRKRR